VSPLWQNADYVRFWGAAATSNFGSMLHAIALPLAAIMLLDASPADIALLSAAGLVPAVALGLLAGSWVDRLRRRPVLVACDWLRAGVVVSIPVAAMFGRLSLAQLMLTSLLLGLLGFVFSVAHHSYLPSLVERDQLVPANSQLKVAEAVTEGGAFAVGGWLVQRLGAPMVLGLDAFSFAISALFLWRIRRPELVRTREAVPARMGQEIAEGLAFIRRTPVLLVIAVVDALGAFSFRVTLVVYMLFVYEELGFSLALLGLVFAVGSVSSLLGAGAASRIVARIGIGPSMVAGFAVTGLSLMALPLAPGATWLGVALLVLHQLGDGGAILYEIGEVSARQAITPPEMLGRVSASLRTLGAAAMLLGVFAGGLIGETLGLRATLVVGGAVACAGALLLFCSPVRRLRGMPAPG
jgi:MFS family permease